MTIRGLNAVKRRLRSIPQHIIDEVSKQLEKEASKLVSEMRSLVPEDQGTLKASIGWRWGEAGEGQFTIGTFKGSANAKLKITVFAGDATTQDGAFNVARLQEFGTVKMAANPFFFPAYRASRRNISSNLSRAVTRGAKKA